MKMDRSCPVKRYNSRDTCGWCESEDIDCDYVDIGVGWVQCTPYTCGFCGAIQMSGNELWGEKQGTEEEREIGWWKSPWFDQIPLDELPKYAISIEEVFETDPMRQFAIEVEEVTCDQVKKETIVEC